MASSAKDRSITDMDLVQNFDQLRADIAALTETVARLASEGATSAKSEIRDSRAGWLARPMLQVNSSFRTPLFWVGMLRTQRMSLQPRSSIRSHVVP